MRWPEEIINPDRFIIALSLSSSSCFSKFFNFEQHQQTNVGCGAQLRKASMMSHIINSEQESKLLIKLPEAAQLLSMCERTLWSLAATGVVPSFKVGRSRFFSVAALMEWIDTNLADGGAI